MSILLVVAAVLAGVLFVVVGVFSLAALVWGDLLESDRPRPAKRMSKAA